ncbi:MAG: hypothetical protein M3040_13155 [Bacteroidota bacterium]|nr:hypothetical protein [Bacteroidota bacterium]
MNATGHVSKTKTGCITNATYNEQKCFTAEVRFNAGVITQVDYLIAKNKVERGQKQN